MTTLMDKTTAMMIATRFLRQHFSVLNVDAVLVDGKTWEVTAQIELFGNVKVEKMRIDAATSERHAHISTVTP
jgi:hypothetical protein